MTKQQVIDILEAYRPSGIYSGIYQMFQKNFNEKYINLLIDEIIGRVKCEPDNWIKCKPEPNSGWIRCSERLPKQESFGERMVSACVLVYTSDGDMCKARYCDNEWLDFSFGLFVLPFSEDVIYWRPLPEPPKEDNCIGENNT